MNRNIQAICPVCEEGVLTPETFGDQVRFENAYITVAQLERSRCSQCAADPLLPEQIKRNQRKIADAKRRAVGRLTGDEIRATREVLGLSQADAAQVFGGGENAFSKYERGEVVQSAQMDSLLRIVAANPWLLAQLRIRGTDAPIPEMTADYVNEAKVAVSTSSTRRIRGHLTLVSSSSWKSAA